MAARRAAPSARGGQVFAAAARPPATMRAALRCRRAPRLRPASRRQAAPPAVPPACAPRLCARLTPSARRAARVRSGGGAPRAPPPHRELRARHVGPRIRSVRAAGGGCVRLEKRVGRREDDCMKSACVRVRSGRLGRKRTEEGAREVVQVVRGAEGGDAREGIGVGAHAVGEHCGEQPRPLLEHSAAARVTVRSRHKSELRVPAPAVRCAPWRGPAGRPARCTCASQVSCELGGRAARDRGGRPPAAA
eukprot:7015050-Prymnesium_polylepis.1